MKLLIAATIVGIVLLVAAILIENPSIEDHGGILTLLTRWYFILYFAVLLGLFVKSMLKKKNRTIGPD